MEALGIARRGILRATVDIRDFHHFTTQNHLGPSQSIDVTRILPRSSRLKANVVLSVVASRSKTFSTMSTGRGAATPEGYYGCTERN